jgi:hypothetical protein
VAVIGQMGFASEHLKQWGFAGQLLFALSLESVAVYLSWHAMNAERRNDSALRLVLASYLFGLFVALINYSHYAKPLNNPNVLAIVVGTMSMMSPILWRIHSRAVSRNILMQRNLIDEHALRMGNRWIWHPIRSARVMYLATWMGQSNPTKAIAAWEEIEKEKAKKKIIKEIKPSMNGQDHSLDIESLDH